MTTKADVEFMTNRFDSTTLRDNLARLLENWSMSEILDGLSKEAGWWARREKSEAWSVARKAIIKAAKVAEEVGL